MTSRELNQKLILAIPVLQETYNQETAWQDGDDTGSHIIYGDVLLPFIKEQLQNTNIEALKQIFTFVEGILEKNDAYANEVIAFSVIESLLYDEEIDVTMLTSLAGEATLHLIEEILEQL